MNNCTFSVSEVQIRLLSTALNNELIEKLYPAQVAGLGYTCNRSTMGLFFMVNSLTEIWITKIFFISNWRISSI